MTKPTVPSTMAKPGVPGARRASTGSAPRTTRPGPPAGSAPGGRLSRLATSSAVRRQRRVWSGRVSSWDHHSSAGLGKVTAAVLAAAAARPGQVVVDLGCGTGQLSLPLAERGARVLAVDVSQAMVRKLADKAAAAGLSELETACAPIETLSLPDGSADLIVTSYALHHLRDADKSRLVAAAFHWLRPGGRLLIADMMFGRGGTSRDRSIIRSKIMVFARRGPAGWWRIAKNGVRYVLRIHERPVSMDAWTSMLREAGFAEVTAAPIVAEASLVTGRRPG